MMLIIKIQKIEIVNKRWKSSLRKLYNGIKTAPHAVKKCWKYKDIQDIVECKNGTFTITHFHYFFLEAKLLMMFGVVLPFTRFGK